MQFHTQDDVISYVERELAKALPPGWSSQRAVHDSLLWQIKPDRPLTAAPSEDYRLRVTGDWSLFILEHGNSDAGALILHHALLNAKVMDAKALDYFPLSTAIRDVIGQCRPNEWGWT